MALGAYGSGFRVWGFGGGLGVHRAWGVWGVGGGGGGPLGCWGVWALGLGCGVWGFRAFTLNPKP